MFDLWIVPAKGLKNGEVFQIEVKYFIKFFDKMLLSAYVERVSVSCKRDFFLSDKKIPSEKTQKVILSV